MPSSGRTGRALCPIRSSASTSRPTRSGSSGAPRSKDRTTSRTSTRCRTASRRSRRGAEAKREYPQWPAYDVSNPLNFFLLLNEGLRHNPPQGADLVLLGLFETLNIGPNKTFDPAQLDVATAAGLTRASEIGSQILAADFKTRVGKLISGWQITNDLGSWRTLDTDQLDFLRRSAISKEAQPGQNSSEAIYPFTFSDADGQPLTGANRYGCASRRASSPRSAHSGRSRCMTRKDCNPKSHSALSDWNLRQPQAGRGRVNAHLYPARQPRQGQGGPLAARA